MGGKGINGITHNSLEAVVDHVLDHVKPEIEAMVGGKHPSSSDEMKGLAEEVVEEALRENTTFVTRRDLENAMRETAKKVFAEEIDGHTLKCLQPGGPLFRFGEKVDRINRSVLLATGAVMLVVILIPLAGVLMNWRLQKLDALQAQVMQLVAQHSAIGAKP